jgi:hypothetical protein
VRARPRQTQVSSSQGTPTRPTGDRLSKDSLFFCDEHLACHAGFPGSRGSRGPPPLHREFDAMNARTAPSSARCETEAAAGDMLVG